MGFNNLGIDHLMEQVRQRRYRGILGINIGKNANTPVEKAVDDYLICMEKAYAHADYITVNISSPNTPGLRTLQFGDTLVNLLAPLKAAQARLAQLHGKQVPLAVKIAPDMNHEEIRATARALLDQGIDGVIATNTTVGRAGVENSPLAAEAGGLSGAPLTDKATEVIACLTDELAGRIPIIGVGGIFSGEDALAKLAAGASLIQIYSGFIYRGPALVKDVIEAVRKGR